MNALNQANIKATFCVVGSRVREYPAIFQRIYQSGHEICAHTWSHRYLTTQTNDQIVAEMEWTLKAIQKVIGVRPTLARPPFGDIDDRVRAIFKAMGLKTLLRNRDAIDWRVNNPSNSYNPCCITANFTM